MNVVNLIAIAVTLVVGFSVWQANPKRAMNRAFVFVSVVSTLWLWGLLEVSVHTSTNPLLWLKATSAVAGFFPVSLWLTKSSALGAPFNWRQQLKAWPWYLAAIVLAVIACSNWVFSESVDPSHHEHVRGLGWVTYQTVLGGAFLALLVQSLREVGRTQGIQRVELQTLLFGGSIAGVVGILIVVLGTVAHQPDLASLLPLAVGAFYAFTAWAITTQKIFFAWYILRSSVHMAAFAGFVLLGITILLPLAQVSFTRTQSVVLVVAAITTAFYLINRSLPKAGTDGLATRNGILIAGRDNVEQGALINRFGAILSTWGRTEHVHFLFGGGGTKFASRTGIELPSEGQVTDEIRRLGWATPESLNRRRATESSNALYEFMRQKELGVLVTSPSQDGKTRCIVGLNQRGDRRPYTWPEVQFLQELTVLMDGAFDRADLFQQTRHSEQLATAGLLGASLAHEIRNPLVSLKTIIQSAKTRFDEPGYKRLLTDVLPSEIERIETIVSGLMELGQPREPHHAQLNLNAIVRSVVDLVGPKASEEAVRIDCQLVAKDDQMVGDSGQLRSVILNLVMNAIQAFDGTDGRREIIIRTERADDDLTLEVSDNGPGIPPEIRNRIFQPFTTANKTKGVGLGLAITADTVRMHGGKITLLDRDEAGTTFRVTIPCRQPSY